MDLAIELNNEDIRLINYLKECLDEDKISYEIKIEERWTKNYKQASKCYQVYCIYVNKNDVDKVKKYMKDFENGTIITDGIDELKSIEDEEYEKKFKFFTLKNFLKYYWLTLLFVGIFIVIGIKFFKF